MTAGDHHHSAAPSAASVHHRERLAIDQLNAIAASHRKFSCILVTPYVLAESKDETAADDVVNSLAKLPIHAVAASGARVYVWVPSPHLFRLLGMLPAWQCRYETAAMCVARSSAAEDVSLLLQSSYGSETKRSLSCKHVLPCMTGPSELDEESLRAALETSDDEGRLHVFARTASAGWTVAGA